MNQVFSNNILRVRAGLLLLSTVVMMANAGCGTTQLADFDAIERGWRTENIAVKQGGSKPTVIQMLRAFNAVWPTEAANRVIAEVGDNPNVDKLGIVVDKEDFSYVSYVYVDPETDDYSSPKIQASTYPRDNGHMMFAVCLEDNLCCFYDYDPSSQTLTPEDEPYRHLTAYAPIESTVHLGAEFYPQNIILEEYTHDGNTRYHHYFWNGMKHVVLYIGDSDYILEEEDMHNRPEWEEVGQSEGMEYLKFFYWGMSLSYNKEYLMAHITPRAKQYLMERYDYECETGDCLAIWLFDHDKPLELGEMRSRVMEDLGDNMYRVTLYSDYEENGYDLYEYAIRIGLVKDDGTYKIDFIETERSQGIKR